MDLIKVDGLRVQPAEAVLQAAAQRGGVQRLPYPTALVPDVAGLGEDERAFVHAPQRPCDQALAVTEAVDGGGIDPVDATRQRRGDRAQASLVIGTPARAGKLASAQLPAAAADTAELQAGHPEPPQRRPDRAPRRPPTREQNRRGSPCDPGTAREVVGAVREARILLARAERDDDHRYLIASGFVAAPVAPTTLSGAAA